MNTICTFRLPVYHIISSRLELTALTITWYTVPCLLIRASSDLFNVIFYFLPWPALSEVSNRSRQPEFTLGAVSFLTGNVFISSSPFRFSLLCLSPYNLPTKWWTLSDGACNSAMNAARSPLPPNVATCFKEGGHLFGPHLAQWDPEWASLYAVPLCKC